MSETTTITVGGQKPYPVLVGEGIRDDIAPLLGDEVHKVLIIHQPTLATAAAALQKNLGRHYEVVMAEIPDGEMAKRAEVASFCWQVMGLADFTRSDAIVGFGGGAATDLAGFVASTWLRGVRVVQVPTTLLAMVDAAIGGKTGINTSEGKNLVGTFYPPSAVVADLETLEPLPEVDLLAGFGEVVKYGFIADEAILQTIEKDVAVATSPLSPEFRDIVERCIKIKADVVGRDLTEQGPREILNYGHTLGHAIEHAERYRWRHGHAVSIGMVYVAELARLAGRLSDEVADRHRAILTSLDLPTTYPATRWKSLVATMHRDKKARGDMLRFVVLEDIGHPTIMQAPDPSLMYSAYEEIAEKPARRRPTGAAGARH
ncbi:MAG TPA: 3-dehydroquinate synthase [Microbacteriaceae bacterium]|nr:3-dehydroquinate synthase [Microbacteriaceae bacterium]